MDEHQSEVATALNQLQSASSSYLRSAQHQPVNWHAWGNAAFAKAQAEKGQAAGGQPEGEAPKSEEKKKDDGVIDAEVVDEKK